MSPNEFTTLDAQTAESSLAKLTSFELAEFEMGKPFDPEIYCAEDDPTIGCQAHYFNEEN